MADEKPAKGKMTKAGQEKLGAVLKVAVQSYRAGWAGAVATMLEHKHIPIEVLAQKMAHMEDNTSDEEIAKIIEHIRTAQVEPATSPEDLH